MTPREHDPYSIATVLHDAPCLLCRASMRWLRDHDREGRFRFVPLDSDEGRLLLFESGLEPVQADSVVLVHEGRALRYSSALATALRLLGGRWELLGTMLSWVPAPVRDSLYRIVAAHRHLWPFGGACEVPVQDPPSREITVSTAERSISKVAPSGSSRRSGAASRSTKPGIESTTTTGRKAKE